MGSTGDPPVPLGDSPSGRARRPLPKGQSLLAPGALPVPPGESPGGTGQWPVLPKNESPDTLWVRCRVLVLRFGFHARPMLLARVEGNLIATRKHPSLEGWRLVICQPINDAGEAEGTPQVAIDPHGAGMHERAIISSDGMAARKAVNDGNSHVRCMILGTV